MTNKERKEMLDRWVKDLNPKAFLHHADARLGSYWAIATKSELGGMRIWTQFMTLKEMEKALILVHDNTFMEIKNA